MKWSKIECAIICFAIFSVAMSAGVLYVLVHFIAKLW